VGLVFAIRFQSRSVPAKGFGWCATMGELNDLQSQLFGEHTSWLT
jgi:hypothetical protein